MDVTSLFNEEPEGKWYKVPGTEVTVQIRNLKPKMRREIVKRCMRRRVKRGAAIEETDDIKLNDLILQYCVQDWRGIEENGGDLPVTPENKRKLDDNWSEFAGLWNRVIEQQNETDQDIEEIDQKN